MTTMLTEVYDAKFAKLERQLIELEGRMATRFAELESRMTTLSATLEGRMAALEGRMTTLSAMLEGRMSRLDWMFGFLLILNATLLIKAFWPH